MGKSMSVPPRYKTSPERFLKATSTRRNGDTKTRSKGHHFSRFQPKEALFANNSNGKQGNTQVRVSSVEEAIAIGEYSTRKH